MLARNSWVCKTRVNWIANPIIFEQYQTRAPTYEYMLYNRFWRWSTDFEDWAAPKPVYLSDVRPSKAGQHERFMKARRPNDQ